METLGVKHSCHYKALFTVTHYFFIDIAFVPHFFHAWSLSRDCIYEGKKNSYAKSAQSSFLSLCLKKKFCMCSSPNLLSCRNLPTTSASSFKHSLFWKLHSGHKDAVNLQRCPWVPQEFFAAEITSCVQYLIYAYFFVRPLQGSKWGLSGRVVDCEVWIFDR